MNIGTVFSGIGSFEQALIKLNIDHKISFACDIDKYVKQSYLANYDLLEENFHNDITKLNSSMIKDDIDILVGGSPCQSFSVAGKRGGFEDTRGTLFFEFARLVKELKPKVFIYENVKGLTSHDSGKTFEIILNTFNELGYKYYYKILNSKDYGIPQNRQRIFVVGFKDNNINFEFPIKQELKIKVKDLLEKDVEEKYYYKNDHNILNNNINFIRKRKDTSRGDNREIKSGLCPTLTASMGLGGNNVPVINEKFFYEKNDGLLRKFTPRECLRLMGFPDDFKIVLSNMHIYKQVGNSIVVNVLEEIMKNINISLNKGEVND